VGIDGVRLAALAGGERPGAGGQLRRDIDDGFAVGEQPLGDVPADAVAAPAQTRSVCLRPAASMALRPLRSVKNRPRPTVCSRSLTTSMVAERFCGSTPVTTLATCSPLFPCPTWVSAGG
jgi:hypothetical protein